jgi:hypothetical protein
MAFTMAYPNFKKGLKMVSRPLGVKEARVTLAVGALEVQVAVSHQIYTWCSKRLNV